MEKVYCKAGNCNSILRPERIYFFTIIFCKVKLKEMFINWFLKAHCIVYFFCLLLFNNKCIEIYRNTLNNPFENGTFIKINGQFTYGYFNLRRTS